MDTPGIHQPLHKLGAIMVDQAAETIPDADLVLWVVDVHDSPADEDRQVAELVTRARDVPALLVLNKTDLLQPERAATQEKRYLELAPHAERDLRFGGHRRPSDRVARSA